MKNFVIAIMSIILSSCCGESLSVYTEDSLNLTGDRVTVSGITYKLSSDNLEASVIGYTNDVLANVTVPDAISVNNADYVITSIADSAFAYCPSTNISLPSTIEKIRNGAFYGSKAESILLPAIADIQLGDGVFMLCERLTNIIVPTGVTNLPFETFEGCISLRTISLPNTLIFIDDFAFYKCTSLQSINIPNSVNSVGRSCFENCTSLVNITLPNGITEIPSGMFAGCEKIINIDIPKTVTGLGTNAFHGCENLEEIVLPGELTQIGDACFRGCSKLKSIVIPDHVTSISFMAFSGCICLKSITLPQSLKCIRWHAFQGCSGLKSIQFPDGLVEIENRAFGDTMCALETIVIPASVTTIGSGAFFRPSHLKLIEIYSNDLTIGDTAFGSDSQLDNTYDIICHSLIPPTLEGNPFLGHNPNVKVYVPTIVLDDYMNAPSWSKFESILPY